MKYTCVALNNTEKSCLKKIKQNIYLSIIRPLQSESNFKEIFNWYHEICSADNIDSIRYLVCMGIDISNGLVEPGWIQIILKKMDYTNTTISPLQKFDACLASNRVIFYKDSNCCDKSYTQEKYTSVMNWGKLFENVKLKLSRTKYSSPITNAQSDYYFSKIIMTKQLKLDCVDDWASYRTGLTWLLPHNELLGIINTNKANPDISNVILDAIGLEPYNYDPKKGYDNIIYVEFPDRFVLPCYQPTTLCESWNYSDGLYLSFKKYDGYGRTYSTSGGFATVKERVLSLRKYSDQDFIPFNIGRPNKGLVKNNKRIINTAISRY